MNNKDKTTADQEFFLPDLCNVQAVLFLVLVAELLAFVLELADGSLQTFSWQSFSLTSLFVQWSFLLSAALLCQIRPKLIDRPLAQAAGICYLLILAVVASTSVLGQWLLSGVLASGRSWSIDGWQLTTHVLICAMLAGIILRYFYLTQQLRLNQRAELQSRIQALQSRIRPHFLFNSMNIIASLISIDPDLAEEVVEDLSSLFRASLNDSTSEPVTLAQELDLCEKYVYIESLRLDDRLTVQWDVNVDTAAISIPLHPSMTQKNINKVIYALKDIFYE